MEATDGEGPPMAFHAVYRKILMAWDLVSFGRHPEPDITGIKVGDKDRMERKTGLLFPPLKFGELSVLSLYQEWHFSFLISFVPILLLRAGTSFFPRTQAREFDHGRAVAQPRSTASASTGET